jgi:AhpD family alkylhydroperoxidase
MKLRASQINHCAFCCKMHSSDALSHGIAADKLHTLPAWRETEYFSAQERAALALVEAVTLIADGQVPDDVYEEAAAVLNEKQLAAVQWLAITINAWNRIAIASRYPVGP